MTDIDPNGLEKKAERIGELEEIMDLLLANIKQLFQGNVIKARRIKTDDEGNEIVEEIFQEVTAADRSAVIRMLVANGMRLDPTDLPTNLLNQMRRQLSDPKEDADLELDDVFGT
jgi:hypothetical protein